MQALECPFKTAREAIDQMRQETKLIIVDIHAEATSEKVALGWYLDGLVSAVVGTHTHIQTADEKILPAGSAFIADVGMTGSMDSVIGRKVEDVLERFLTCVPRKFNIAENNIQLHGVIIEVDQASGKASSIIRIQHKV
jgi:2',3'-cyclic-nucleotide 2'-phosphodiesterase